MPSGANSWILSGGIGLVTRLVGSNPWLINCVPGLAGVLEDLGLPSARILVSVGIADLGSWQGSLRVLSSSLSMSLVLVLVLVLVLALALVLVLVSSPSVESMLSQLDSRMVRLALWILEGGRSEPDLPPTRFLPISPGASVDILREFS